MESPGILVVEVYTYRGVPLSTEYLYITGYRCPAAPRCTCFVDTDSFTVRPDIASAIIYCCKRSSGFTSSVNRYCRWYKRKVLKRLYCKSHLCLANLNFVLHDELYSQIDYAWDQRLEALSYKWSLLVDATAWLSTLGGGHSALGEQLPTHAVTAGQISFKQFRLALELGDKGLEYRCQLYYALSLIQQDQLSQSKTLIKWIYTEAKQSLRDERLLTMCQGVWSKLRYHYKLRKQSRMGLNNKTDSTTATNAYKHDSRLR